MKILFILVLHHFGDIQPVVIPASSKIEACDAAKSWTNPYLKMIGASSYATSVFAVEGQANGAISAFLYEVSCDNIKAYDFKTDLKEIEAKVAGRLCRKFADDKEWQKYFQCVSDKLENRMSDTEYIDLLDGIDKRITALENKDFIEKGKKKP